MRLTDEEVDRVGGSVEHDVSSRGLVTTNAPVLLYDGVCALCSSAVRFVLAHDRSGTIRFAALDSEFARRVVVRHPELSDVDSLVLVEPRFADERVSVRSEAILRVARHMGGPWRAAAMLRVLPRALRDASYDLVARSRKRAFGAAPACPHYHARKPEPGVPQAPA